ncbi:putative quinol monooxygenase [Iodobacter ciconiae]|nr:putative quinol monooxygenase [Iodobacter ciconiae]
MSMYIFATLESLPHTVEEVRAVLRNMAVSSRQEPGCLHYQLLQSAEQPTLLHVFEEYKDAESISAHQASPHYQNYRQIISDKLARQPSVTIMTSLLTDRSGH